MTFDRMTPVLHFGPDPRPLRYRERREREWVLWPVFAYQVIVPAPRERPFNLFQEYTIRLCRAGVRKAGDVGNRLGIGRELAAYVLAELVQMGMLDPDAAPTLRAIRELEETEAAVGEPVTGFVFQDAHTLTLLPRFVRGPLPQVGVESYRHDESAPTYRIELGTTGNSEVRAATALVPTQRPSVPPPTTWSILAACRDHLRHARGHHRACGRPAGDVPGGIGGVEGVREVSLVSPEPRPVFLTTFLFVPETEAGVGEWQVCDPFGLGPSITLRNQLDGLARSGSAGPADLLLRIVERAETVSAIELAEEKAAARRRAEEAVAAELGSEAREWPALFRQFADAESVLHEARGHAGRGGQAQREYRSRLKSFITRAYAVAEELFDVVLGLYPPTDGGPPAPGEAPRAGDTLAALSREGPENAELLGRLAREAGLRDAEPAVFPSFFRMTRAQAKQVVSYDGRRLPVQFGVMVAVARDLPGHPLYFLASTFPDCVPFLVGLKRQRDGAAAHAGEVAVDENPEPIRTGLYRLARGLIPSLSAGGAGSTAATGTAAREAVLLRHRLRARAARGVLRRFGPDVRTRRKLYAHLIDMHTWLEEFRATESGEPDRLLAVDALREGCSAVEAALEDVLRSFPPRGDSAPPGRDRAENARKFDTIALELGFQTADRRLPESLSTIPSDRLQKTLAAAARGSEVRGTLNALTLSLLWTAAADASHPFRAVARDRPTLLLDLADLTSRREHLDDRTRIQSGEVDQLTETIAGVVATLMRFSY